MTRPWSLRGMSFTTDTSVLKSYFIVKKNKNCLYCFTQENNRFGWKPQHCRSFDKSRKLPTNNDEYFTRALKQNASVINTNQSQIEIQFSPLSCAYQILTAKRLESDDLCI